MAAASSRLSENVSEKRRGRPKAWHADDLIGSMSDAKTERGRANFRLAVAAIGEMKSAWEPTFAWFWRMPPIETYDELHVKVIAGTAKWRGTVLAELGRELGGDLLGLARALAALSMETTTRNAVRAIREWRGTRRNISANAFDLTIALCGALDAYITEHRDTTRQQIEAALRNVIESYDLALASPEIPETVE